MISIILRAKDELPWLKYTLKMLDRQQRRDFELICVDSGSTDGSYELLQAHAADLLYQIEPSAYIPGKVLNEAIAKAKGEYIVFNNADCIPCDRYWLGNLVGSLERDPALVGVYARQIPRPSAMPLVRKDYERAFGDGSIAAKWRHFFSLASSAVRADLIREHPFNNELQYSEDIEWSWRMKSLGYKIAYQKDAKVEHSHDYSLAQIKKRYLGEGRAEASIYADLIRENPSAYSFLRSVIVSAKLETLRDYIYLIKHGDWDWLPRAPIYRLAQRYWAYRGRNEDLR